VRSKKRKITELREQFLQSKSTLEDRGSKSVKRLRNHQDESTNASQEKQKVDRARSLFSTTDSGTISSNVDKSTQTAWPENTPYSSAVYVSFKC